MQDVVFFDRYRNERCVEKIYGEKYLRWTYETLPGQLALFAAVKRAWLSRWYGRRMDHPRSRQLIEPFIDQYQLDPTEFARDPDEFESFNAFFYRQLKPQARPIHPADDTVTFPADGRHLCVPDLSRCDGLLVKGQMFQLPALLGDHRLAETFSAGSLVISRLCPVDYHRFHFPVGGTTGPTRLINGPLYSVNPIALWTNIHILSTNRRTITLLQSTSAGTVAIVEVGATMIGSICQTCQPDTVVSKGQEKGYFRFGGSTVITLFEPGRVQFDDDLLTHSADRTELYARFGDHMGRLV